MLFALNDQLLVPCRTISSLTKSQGWRIILLRHQVLHPIKASRKVPSFGFFDETEWKTLFRFSGHREVHRKFFNRIFSSLHSTDTNDGAFPSRSLRRIFVSVTEASVGLNRHFSRAGALHNFVGQFIFA